MCVYICQIGGYPWYERMLHAKGSHDYDQVGRREKKERRETNQRRELEIIRTRQRSDGREVQLVEKGL